MIGHLWRGKANAAWVLETAVGKLKERERETFLGTNSA